MHDRLQAIATPLVPNMEKVQIIPPPKDVDPRVLAWKGAAVLGKMDGVADLWVTSADWVSVFFHPVLISVLFLRAAYPASRLSCGPSASLHSERHSDAVYATTVPGPQDPVLLVLFSHSEFRVWVVHFMCSLRHSGSQEMFGMRALKERCFYL